jgi:4-hydroxythreonine-4-phosphate dehydrogenase
MKVYISQGHEKGIGLEVFFKSCLMLPAAELELLELIVFPAAAAATLQQMRMQHQMTDDRLHFGGLALKVRWLQPTKNESQSFISLRAAMQLAEQGGVLFTLPTSKDQFPQDAGHTEFFRRHYQRPALGMFFSSPRLRLLLISDHLAINALASILTADFIYQRTDMAIKELTRWGWPLQRLLLAGLNPHAGEAGLIGQEDERVKQVIQRLQAKYQLAISGPWPGDSMLLEQKTAEDLLVYLYHDQGLGIFKAQQGFIGSNITLGLDYPRVSPDHGTSFSLFGQNAADYRGCLYALREAMQLLKRVQYGKNSSH